MALAKQKHHVGGILRQVWLFRKSILLVTCPFLLSPLLLVNPTSESKCAYGVLLICVYWITAALPPFVTALLPAGIFPIIGLQKSKQFSALYFTDVVFLTLGAGLTSVIIQSRCLHRRIALTILSKTKPTPLCVTVSMWGCSALLSTLISSSAVIKLLSPVALTICREFREIQSDGEQEDLQPMPQELRDFEIEVDPDEIRFNKVPKEHVVKSDNLKKGMILGIIYSSGVGSLVILTGSLTSIILKGHADLLFGPDSRITVFSWFLFACPLSLLMLALIWICLYVRYVKSLSCSINGSNTDIQVTLSKVLQAEYSKLSPIKLADCFVLGYSLLLVVLWFTRCLWAPLFPVTVTDSLPAILVTVLLFSTPGLKAGSSKSGDRDVTRYSRVDWLSVQKLFPWTSLFMIGGGVAMASVYQISGLAEMVSSTLSGSITLPSLVSAIILAAVISLLAEVVSGSVLPNILLPIMADLAMSADSNPLCYMLIVSVASSLGFISPVSRIIGDLIPESELRIQTKELIVSGLVVKLICVLMLILAAYTWAVSVMTLDTPPSWTGMFRHGPVDNTKLILCNSSQF